MARRTTLFLVCAFEVVLILLFLAWSALAEDLVMKCTSPSGKSFNVYKIQNGLFGDKYLFREKIDWKPWCNDNDTDAITKNLREAGMKNVKSLYLNIEKGDNAASCKSGFSFQGSDGINQVLHRFSVLDFFSFRYTTSIGKDKNLTDLLPGYPKVYSCDKGNS